VDLKSANFRRGESAWIDHVAELLAHLYQVTNSGCKIALHHTLLYVLGNPFKKANDPVELPHCVVRPGNPTSDSRCQFSLAVAVGQRGVLVERLVRLRV
jgi:hypothetical protein